MDLPTAVHARALFTYHIFAPTRAHDPSQERSERASEFQANNGFANVPRDAYAYVRTKTRGEGIDIIGVVAWPGQLFMPFSDRCVLFRASVDPANGDSNILFAYADGPYVYLPFGHIQHG